MFFELVNQPMNRKQTEAPRPMIVRWNFRFDRDRRTPGGAGKGSEVADVGIETRLDVLLRSKYKARAPRYVARGVASQSRSGSVLDQRICEHSECILIAVH